MEPDSSYFDRILQSPSFQPASKEKEEEGRPETIQLSQQQQPVEEERLSFSQLVQATTPSASRVVRLNRTVVAEVNKLCVFATLGKCRYGSYCRNVHGLQCPRCLRYALHPTDMDQNEEHIQGCLDKPPEMSLQDLQNELECGICLEKITQKEDPRFGLLNCSHAFCLTCIRAWRNQHVNLLDITLQRSCPLCRQITYFVVPSSSWVTDPEEKRLIIDAYKRKMSTIPCKHYNNGLDVCPFGTSCFYAHAANDPNQVRTMVVDKDQGVRHLREQRLCDFIEFKPAKPNKRR